MTAPMPSLQFYANDIGDFICAIENRGIHPTEVGVVIRVLRGLVVDADAALVDADAARREAREAQTYCANSEAEELADLCDELARAKDRIADLEIKLYDARRKAR